MKEKNIPARVYTYKGKKVFLAHKENVPNAVGLASGDDITCFPVDAYNDCNICIAIDEANKEADSLRDSLHEIVLDECVSDDDCHKLVRGWYTKDYAEFDMVMRNLCMFTDEDYAWTSDLTKIKKIIDERSEHGVVDSEVYFELEKDWKKTIEKYRKGYSSTNVFEFPDFMALLKFSCCFVYVRPSESLKKKESFCGTVVKNKDGAILVASNDDIEPCRYFDDNEAESFFMNEKGKMMKIPGGTLLSAHELKDRPVYVLCSSVAEFCISYQSCRGVTIGGEDYYVVPATYTNCKRVKSLSNEGSDFLFDEDYANDGFRSDDSDVDFEFLFFQTAGFDKYYKGSNGKYYRLNCYESSSDFNDIWLKWVELGEVKKKKE